MVLRKQIPKPLARMSYMSPLTGESMNSRNWSLQRPPNVSKSWLSGFMGTLRSWMPRFALKKISKESNNNCNKEKHIMGTETLRDGTVYDRVSTEDPSIIILKRNGHTGKGFKGIQPGMLVSFKKTPDILRPVVGYDPTTETVTCWKRDRDNDNMLTTDTTFGPLSNVRCAFDFEGNLCYGEDC